MRNPCYVFVFICATLLLPLNTFSMFMTIDRDMPVDEVVNKLEKFVADNPKDAHGHYLLGRVHSMAWAADGNQVRLIPPKNDGLPSFAIYQTVRVNREGGKAPTEPALYHLGQSVASYRKAVKLDPKNGLYHLGLAWMLEQQAATEANAPKPATQPVDPAAKTQEIIDLYVKAFDLTLESDLKTDHLMAGDAYVSLEASGNAIRLLGGMKNADPKLIARLQEGKERILSKPMAVTPIVIAMDGTTTMGDLIDNTASVKFDLSGIASGHNWPWVSKRAGILVWDPQHTGQITSSRQMFGTMTWQMFFRDGYEALSMLDRDGDHRLSGSELNGIAVWQDSNSNSTSDTGEVIPAEKAGITSIDVRSTATTGVLQNLTGVSWRNGTSTASFDWVPMSK